MEFSSTPPVIRGWIASPLWYVYSGDLPAPRTKLTHPSRKSPPWRRLATASTSMTASNSSQNFYQPSKRSMGSSVRRREAKDTRPIIHESATTTGKLPAPQIPAPEDERCLGLTWAPSTRAPPKSKIADGPVAANPLQKYQELFYVKPVKRGWTQVAHRGEQPGSCLAEAAFPPQGLRWQLSRLPIDVS